MFFNVKIIETIFQGGNMKKFIKALTLFAMILVLATGCQKATPGASKGPGTTKEAGFTNMYSVIQVESLLGWMQDIKSKVLQQNKIFNWAIFNVLPDFM